MGLPEVLIVISRSFLPFFLLYFLYGCPAPRCDSDPVVILGKHIVNQWLEPSVTARCKRLQEGRMMRGFVAVSCFM